MKIKTFIGIDPGASGAIAYYTDKGGPVAVKMPKSTEDMLAYFSHLKDISSEPVVFLEKVQMWSSDSDAENKGKQFRINVMLAGYEKLKVCLVQAQLPYIEVYPATWQKYLNLYKKGEEKSDRKKRYKAAAQSYFPQLAATLWNADALCLIQFGRTKYHTEKEWITSKLPQTNQPKLL